MSHGNDLLDICFENSRQTNCSTIGDTVRLPTLHHRREPRVAKEMPENLVYELVQGNGEEVQPLVDPSAGPRDALHKSRPGSEINKRKLTDSSASVEHKQSKQRFHSCRTVAVIR
jgi:hypothetical protein